MTTTKREVPSFSIPAATSIDDVVATIRQHLPVHLESTSPCTRRYYDSFDGLLHHAETMLFQETEGRKKRLHWERYQSLEPVLTLKRTKAPQFAMDLPTGPFRDHLTPILGYRALLPFINIQYHKQVFSIRDDEEKTTARLIVAKDMTAATASTGTRTSLGTVLRIAPIKGYTAVARKLDNLLRKTLALPQHNLSLLQTAFDALSYTPGAATKKDPVLDPNLRTDEALRQILRSLLETIEINEAGTRADIDTEFLHDFRVAVRRTRSVLSQLKTILPPDLLAHYRPEFKWLGSITGPTRDLDVYLLKFGRYQAWLPEEIQGDLDPLRDFLTAQQRKEQRRMARAMKTERYRTLIEGWKTFLQGPAPEPPPSHEATLPVLTVASARIWRTYKKVIQEGQAIVDNPATPAEALHDLRIRCKKLRYLLELFRSLYPPKKLRLLIKALKNLQDNLGDFNDFEVQQHTLQRFALQMLQGEKKQVEVFLAMGRLEAYMEQRQRETRDEFAERFIRFASPENQQQFRALFKDTA